MASGHLNQRVHQPPLNFRLLVKTYNLKTQKLSSILRLNLAGFEGQVQVVFTTVRLSNVRRHIKSKIQNLNSKKLKGSNKISKIHFKVQYSRFGHLNFLDLISMSSFNRNSYRGKQDLNFHQNLPNLILKKNFKY